MCRGELSETGHPNLSVYLIKRIGLAEIEGENPTGVVTQSAIR